MVGQSAQAMAQVAAAIGRVMEINPALLRADTPLSELGLDNVGLVATADLLESAGHVGDPGAFAQALRTSRTVGELAAVLDRQEPTFEASNNG